MQTGDPTGDSLYYPVLQGVSPLSALPSLASVQTQTINPYTWGPRKPTINTWFDSNIVPLTQWHLLPGTEELRDRGPRPSASGRARPRGGRAWPRGSRHRRARRAGRCSGCC